MVSTKNGENNQGNAELGNSESLSGTEADDGSYILKEKYSEENGKLSTAKIFTAEVDEKSPQFRKKQMRQQSKKEIFKKVG